MGLQHHAFNVLVCVGIRFRGDFVQRVPNSTWFRAGASAMGRFGKLFWRADIGLDLALNEDDVITYSPVFRISQPEH